jgi:16S rRNA (guanine527-N7)-methyltransferase
VGLGSDTGLEAALASRLAFPAPIVLRLAQYGELLLDANRRTNLTGAKSAAELVEHIADSLEVLPYVRGRLVDVGSGGGLPAIPLTIASGCAVTMIESVRKKARFLERAVSELQLEGEVIVERAEEAARDARLRDRFDVGTARAVAGAPTVAELVLPFIAPGGAAILQRGTMDERERSALSDAALILASSVEGEHVVFGNRRLIVIRKTGPTPERFPRRPGIPQKRPLCNG